MFDVQKARAESKDTDGIAPQRGLTNNRPMAETPPEPAW